jgi:hypothetical protein
VGYLDLYLSLLLSFSLLVPDVHEFSFSSVLQLCIFCLNSVLIICSQLCVFIVVVCFVQVCVCVCLFSFSVLAHEWVELCVVVVLLGCLGILSVPLLVCYAVCVGLVEVFLLCVALLTAGVFFFFFFVWLR